MIRVEGLSLEKLLNIAADAGVKVYDVKRESYTVLYAGVSERGYRKLIKIAPDRYTLTELKAKGAPVRLKWLFGRKALFIGIIIVAIGIFAASQFVWEVRVTGISVYEGTKIKTELAGLGIVPGVYKGNLDLKGITTKMLIAHDEIAWMDIKLDGVVVTAKIVPADMPPEVYDEDRPCDIIAKKDAYIESVTELAGRAVVKPGDTVRAGDKLISGLVWDEGKPRILFAAKGRIIGSIWYAGEASGSIFEENREKTGNTETERVIYVGKDRASIDGPCTFSEFDTEVAGEYYLGDALFLPVKVQNLLHSEVRLTQKPKELDVLMTYIEEKAYYDAQSKAPENAKITGHKAVFKVDGSLLTVKVYLQTQEEIGEVVYLEE